MDQKAFNVHLDISNNYPATAKDVDGLGNIYSKTKTEIISLNSTLLIKHKSLPSLENCFFISLFGIYFPFNTGGKEMTQSHFPSPVFALGKQGLA